MTNPQNDSLLWWLIPGVLAGMPRPIIHQERRMASNSAVADFSDELPVLYTAGIRAVVSLLNLPNDAKVWESSGFGFLCLPIPDGGAPTLEQADAFVHFVASQRAAQRPVAVHCEAGLGRTGTMLAVYLISEGDSAAGAIAKVRTVENSAIETNRQIHFLEMYAKRLPSHSG